MRLVYRLGQFWRSATAGALPDQARAHIASHLSERERCLFESLPHAEQWHAFGVFRTLKEAGHAQQQLLAAALLHDAGKSCSPLSVWERTAIVVVGALAAERSREWGESTATGWKRPFVVRAHHALWGADLAEQAGSHPLTVALIRRHQERQPPTMDGLEDHLLALLQWADDQN